MQRSHAQLSGDWLRDRGMDDDTSRHMQRRKLLHHLVWASVRESHLLQVRGILLCKGMTRSRRVSRLSGFRQSEFTLAHDLRDVDWFANPSLQDRAISLQTHDEDGSVVAVEFR